MRSISPLLSLSAGLALALAAMGAPAQESEAPEPTVTRGPTVVLMPPAVSVSWAWIVPDADGEGERVVFASPVDLETPVERLGTIRFRYEGERAAAALEIDVPLPPNLEYVMDSATGPGAEGRYLEETRRIRWVVPGPLEPGTVGLVSFRALPRVAATEDAGDVR
ncbi:MAG: hypothetical protein PVI87_08220 [Gammaproteobacteria bacterium]